MLSLFTSNGKIVVKCANQTTNINFNLDIFNKLQT